MIVLILKLFWNQYEKVKMARAAELIKLVDESLIGSHNQYVYPTHPLTKKIWTEYPEVKEKLKSYKIY